jgi:hypothetical protein
VLLPIHLNGAAKGLYINPASHNRSAADEIHEDNNLMLTSINMVLQSPEFTAAHLVLAAVFICIVISILVYAFSRVPLVQEFNFAGCDEDVGVEQAEIIKEGRNQIRTFDRKYQMTLNSNTTDCKHNAMIVSPYTVVVHGFPRALNHKYIFMQMIQPLIENQEAVLKVSLVLDLTKRVELEKKLEKTNRRLEHFEYLMEEQNEC